jgi:hypothetical protein
MKDMMSTPKAQKVLFFALVAVLLAGCGAGKTVSETTDFASRATPDEVANGGEKAWSYCNEGIAKSSTFKFSMKYYTENGQTRNDLMNLKLTQVPSDFETSGDYIQMYRWQAAPSGSTYLDPTPVQFRIINPNNGTIVISNANSIRWADVSTSASQLGISDPTTYFKYVKFIVDLRDQLGQFDVLRVVNYGSNNAAKDTSDALLPVFRADPAGYAYESDGQARATILKNLHPFVGRSSQGWSVKDFQTWANGYCSAF